MNQPVYSTLEFAVAVFQHVYESYFGAGRSIYDVAA